MFDVLSGRDHSQGLFHGDHLRQTLSCAVSYECGWVDWVAIEDEQEFEGTNKLALGAIGVMEKFGGTVGVDLR